jgi:hypothetical protein
MLTINVGIVRVDLLKDYGLRLDPYRSLEACLLCKVMVAREGTIGVDI